MDADATGVVPDAIFQIATGFMAAKLLFVASEVGLFAALADGAPRLDELESRTGIARSRLRVLADAMVALGVVERHGDRYQNGTVAAAFLSGRTPADLRALLRFWDRLSYPTWIKFEDAVRTGRGQSTLSLLEEDQRIFSEGVEALQAGPAHALPRIYDFSRHQRVLDVGGGTGSWLLAILQRHPELTGTLFELPMAAAIARQRLDADPAGNRAEVAVGDFFADPVPDRHDVILIANVIHLFSAERNIELLRRIRERAPHDARLLLVDFWTDQTHTEPSLAALLAGEFLVITGEGDVYSEEEVSGWLTRTGWRALDRRTVAGPISAIVAEAGRLT